MRAHYPYVELFVWFLLRDETPAGYWRSGLAFRLELSVRDWTKKPLAALSIPTCIPYSDRGQCLGGWLPGVATTPSTGVSNAVISAA